MNKRNDRNYNKTVGKNLRLLRELLGMEQADLGRLIGYEQPMVSLIEKGERGLKGEPLLRAAEALNIDVSFLVAEKKYTKEEAQMILDFHKLLRRPEKSKHYDTIKTLLKLSKTE